MSLSDAMQKRLLRPDIGHYRVLVPMCNNVMIDLDSRAGFGHSTAFSKKTLPQIDD